MGEGSVMKGDGSWVRGDGLGLGLQPTITSINDIPTPRPVYYLQYKPLLIIITCIIRS